MSVLLLLDESSDEPGWYNVLPLAGRVDGSRYPDIMLEWAPTTQPTDASQTWENITYLLRGWSWGYGRNDELATFEAGTGNVLLDNRDRLFDPDYAAGTWYGNIKPLRMFRLRYRWDGVVYPGFVAHARGLPQSYPDMGFDQVVQVPLVDTFINLQGVDLIVGFTRPAELTGARIDAVLDTIGVPAGTRDLDAGTVTVAAITIDSPGTSGLAHAKQVALDSEMGSLFVAKDGRVTFHDYSRRLNGSSSHAFTDTAGAALAYTAFETAYDDTYLWNYVRVTGAAGDDSAQVAEDSASQDDYYTITKTLSTQLVSGSEVQQVADRYILRYAQPEQRLPSLQMNGAGNPDTRWPVILDLEVSDRVTATRFADTTPTVLTQNVEGIRHQCVPGGPWNTVVPTSPADTGTYLTLNDATLGELDDINVLA